MSFFREDLQKFVASKGFVLGICNGFQTLVRTGLLPFVTLGKMHATLTNNDSGHFECRWVKMRAEQSQAAYLNNVDFIIETSVNHGEGKFFADDATIARLEREKLIVFRYVDNDGNATTKYPENPNGSRNAIAGITDKTGRILGFMPHPEKFVDITQHPNWRRKNFTRAHGLPIFEKIVQFVANS
jgi:phosphoribosylformylglycinamidine (FGAM) synthase-like amidotransferase family enzyme